MKMTMKTFSSLIKPYKKPNECFHVLKVLTLVMVVVNYITMISVTGPGVGNYYSYYCSY